MSIIDAVVLEGAPAPRGTYFVMRRQADGLLRGIQFSSAPLSNNAELVAQYNRQYGGVWEFIVLTAAGYETVKSLVRRQQQVYMDNPRQMVFRAEGLAVSPRLREIQASQRHAYRGRKLTDWRLSKITDRKVKPLNPYRRGA